MALLAALISQKVLHVCKNRSCKGLSRNWLKSIRNYQNCVPCSITHWLIRPWFHETSVNLSSITNSKPSPNLRGTIPGQCLLRRTDEKHTKRKLHRCRTSLLQTLFIASLKSLFQSHRVLDVCVSMHFHRCPCSGVSLYVILEVHSWSVLIKIDIAIQWYLWVQSVS